MSTATPTRRRLALDPSVALLAVVLIATAALLAYESRSLTFTGDDWSFVMDRRGLDVDVFLRPHNEHLTAGLVLAFKVLLELFGADSYAPFMGLAIAAHLVVVALVYVAARRSVGRWAALAPAAVVATLGPAWNDLLWAFQLGYFVSLAAGLGAFLALERRDRTGDVAAAVLLVVSLCFGSIGIGVIVGVALELALTRGRAARRSAWIVLVPTVLYGLWYLIYGAGSTVLSNVWHIPGYVADAVAASFASISGLSHTAPGAGAETIQLTWGRPLAVAAVALLVVHFARGGRVSPRAWALIATAVVLWTATVMSFGPGREAEASRYQYVNAVLLLLTLAEFARGRRIDQRVGALLAAGTAAVVVANVGILDDRARFWSSVVEGAAAHLAALEVARDGIAPDFQPPNLNPIEAGSYFAAVDSYGSPVEPPSELSAGLRAVVDSSLIDYEGLAIVPAQAPDGASCRRERPRDGVVELEAPAGSSATFRVPDGPPATLRLRRFGDGWAEPGMTLPGGASSGLGLPADRSAQPWRVRIESAAGVTVCRSL